jgi:DNA-binding MarR family transcriptional regulator
MQREERPEARPATRALREILEVSEEFSARMGRHLSVNPTDLSAMEHLIMAGPLGPSELARRLGVTPPAVTAVVDRLEALGHVSRTTNPADRRGVVVTPTPGSVAQAMGMLMPMVTDIDAVLDSFSPAEQAVITDYLDRVVAAYREHLE